MLIASIKDNFSQIIQLINQLDNTSYTLSHPELSNATIGEHIRHIIEMYQSLLKSYDSGIINYDKRERSLQIQTDICFTIEAIQNILTNIDLDNKELSIEQGTNDVYFQVKTNYFRELLYNLEHSIHHQALIKVALLKNPKITISQNFGVAKSTIEYRTQCAQ
jgi:hypothetical protein